MENVNGYEMIEQLMRDHPDWSDQRITDQMLADLEKLRANKRDMALSPIILHATQHIRRNETARRERAAFSRQKFTADGPVIDVLELSNELSEKTFSIGDGQRIPWMTATADQHEERAAYLEKQASGTLAVAARHWQMAKIIRDAGVTCLADLEAGAA